MPKTNRSGFFRRKTLSWWRKAMISDCRSTRDRKKSSSVPQISLRTSTTPQNIAHYRPIGESDSFCGRHSSCAVRAWRTGVASVIRNARSKLRASQYQFRAVQAFGISTVSTTWITPFVQLMSAVVTLAPLTVTPDVPSTWSAAPFTVVGSSFLPETSAAITLPAIT